MTRKFNRRQAIGISLVSGITIAGFSTYNFINKLRNTPVINNKNKEIIRRLAPVVLDLDGSSFESTDKAFFQKLSGIISNLSPTTDKELRDIFMALSLPPFRWVHGLQRDWHDASDDELNEFLNTLSRSPIPLFQVLYQSLISLISSAYYSVEENWPKINYPGLIPVGGIYE